MKKEILLINIQLILNPWFWLLLLCEKFSKTIGESFVDSVTLVIFLHLFFWWLSSVVVALAYANLFIIPPKHIFLSLISYHLFCIFRTLIILSVSSRIVYAHCKSLSTSRLKVDYEWIWQLLFCLVFHISSIEYTSPSSVKAPCCVWFQIINSLYPISRTGIIIAVMSNAD